MNEGAAPAIAFHDLQKTYGTLDAIGGVSLDLPAKQFVALVGASGSGKSTLLKTVNRLIEPTGGRVLVEGRDTQDYTLHDLRRRIGYVFQSIGLFPHMTVGENVRIGPRLSGTRLGEGRVRELLELVDLDPAMAGRMPAELSGGQRQRVGVARALADEAKLLIMDEPFGALDPVTRDALGERVRDLHERLGLTTLMVTHDMAEALLLADRVLVMDSGRIVADETPAGLLRGEGGEIAQRLVEVPRHQARRLAEIG